MSILVVGSVAFDTIRTPAGRCRDVLGGSATYFSVSASHFNSVNLIAVVGEDFQKKHIDFFKKRRIGVRGLVSSRGRTFRWEGEYGRDFGDPRTIATHLNVFSDFNPEIPDEYKDSSHLFLANIDPEIQERVLGQMKRPVLVACDTMNFWIENKRRALLKLLKKVDIFLLNESEAKQLTGKTNLVKAAGEILRYGPERVIIKRGEHGSLLFTQNNIFSIPAYLMESVYDPTGAGDTFAGGLMGYLSTCKAVNRANMRKAVVYGSVMATFAVEGFSLKRLGSIKKADITRRFAEFKKRTKF